MIKKALAVFFAAGMLLPSALLAKGNHPMAGCGLAYILFSKEDNSKPIQILAGTTNNLWGTQTFAITSGTSGCTEDGMLKASAATEVYVDVNFKNLQQEMAAGGGDYLNGLASLLGVKAESRDAFGKFTQDNYAALFPSAESTSTDMLNALSQALSQRPDLLS